MSASGQYQRQQKPDQAETLLTGALAKDPDNPILNAQLASLYDRQGNTAQAQTEIDDFKILSDISDSTRLFLCRNFA